MRTPFSEFNFPRNVSPTASSSPTSTLRVGDGATSGAGTIGTGAVTVTSPGTLELNRPDDFTFSNAFSGTGTIAKGGANTVTIPAAVNFGGSVSLNAGTLRLNAGGTLSGALSGPGALTTTATLQLSGASVNSNTGLTTVSGGVLQLNKTAGVDAVGGNITITGTAQLALQAAEQIPNTATLTMLGSPTR